MKFSGKLGINDRLWARKFVNLSGHRFNPGDEIPIKKLGLSMSCRQRLFSVGLLVPQNMIYKIPEVHRPKVETTVVPKKEVKKPEPKKETKIKEVVQPVKEKEVKPKRVPRKKKTKKVED